MRVMTHMPTRKKKKRASGITAASSSSSAAAATVTSHMTPMRLEKMAICALLMIAWGWIMVTMGMVFYHGYYQQHHHGHHPGDSGFHQHVAYSFPGQKAVDMTPPQLLHNLRFSDEGNRQGQQEEGEGGLQQKEQQQQQPKGQASAAAVIQPYESPLLIFTCHREEYLNQTLADIYRYIPRDCSMGCPIIISQDGNYEPVAKVIKWYQEQFAAKEFNIPLIHWQHTSSLRGASANAATGTAAYKALAVHYGWALNQVFGNKAAAVVGSSAGGTTPVEPKRVLILEEDLHVAVDFFDYFTALAPLLDRDASLLAISAYNDNGFDHAVQDVNRVVRSDFFPGLGWMMTRKLWTSELKVKWPEAYWDDWLREPAQRQGRHVLRPEVSRTFHFGVSGGASNNQFGNQLSKVLLNPTRVQWSTQDLSNLNPQHFDRAYWQMLHSSRRVTSLAEAKDLIGQQQQQAATAAGAAGATNRRPAKELVLRLEYNNLEEFAKFASSLGLSPDEKAGVPRTAYKGVVETRFGTSISPGTNNNKDSSSTNSNNNHILLLTPPMQELQKEFEDVI